MCGLGSHPTIESSKPSQGPWWATNALEQDLRIVPGLADTGHRESLARLGDAVVRVPHFIAYAFVPERGPAKWVVVEWPLLRP
jgi:hypothetical protein